MMHVDKKNIALAVLFGVVILLTGCGKTQQSLDGALKPDAPEQKADPDSLKRFQEAASEGPSAVDSVVELSKKYAALSEMMTQLKLQKENIADENRRLKEKIAAIEPELIQAKKELAEANDLLVEMRIELNNWKSDVLGFRDEMRNANKAQIETLMKILKALGGETKDIPVGQGSEADSQNHTM